MSICRSSSKLNSSDTCVFLSAGISGEENAKEAFEGQIPLGRYADASEIAKLMLFLSGDESEFITGSVHTIDGGFTA